MRALIFERAGAIGVGAFDLAGRPLLVRQLQWLRDLGIEDVVVEVAIGSAAAELGALLLGTDPLTTRCLVIPTRCAIGVQALAARVGIRDDELFLALRADTLVQAPLQLPSEPALYSLPLPSFAAQLPVQLVFQTRVRVPLDVTELHDGWAVCIGDLALAHATSCAVLSGTLAGILVHAAEIKPGIWLARGARVSEDATLLAPVLIGPDARVLGSARIGPNVLVGRQAVIERATVLSDAVIARATLVGEGTRVRQAQVDAHGVTSFADFSRIEVDDPLQLGSATGRGPLLTSRLFALLLALPLLLPWALGFALSAILSRRIVRKVLWRGRNLHVGTSGVGLLDVVPALYDVLLGRRDLVGIAAPRALELEGGRPDGPVRGGALDVSSALAPHASFSTLLWMWRWYLENKTARLDRALWWRQRIAAFAHPTAEKKRSV